MERGVKSIKELTQDQIMLGLPDNLGKSFLLELNEAYNTNFFKIDQFIDDFLNSKGYGGEEADKARRNLSEAAQWLCNKGLLAKYQDAMRESEYFITRLGEKYLKPGSVITL